MLKGSRTTAIALASTVGSFCLAALVSTACTELDPGDVSTGNGPYPEPAASTSASASPDGSTPGDDDDGGSDPDATVAPGTDAATTSKDGGSDSGTVTIIKLPAIFAAAPAYNAANIPTMTAADTATTKNHNFGANGDNPIGQDCSTCHKANGSASGFQWFIGGSITDSTGAGLGGVQIVMVASDGGVVCQVYSDTDGNFYTGNPTATGFTEIPEGAQVMVRLKDGRGQLHAAGPQGRHVRRLRELGLPRTVRRRVSRHAP